MRLPALFRREMSNMFTKLLGTSVGAAALLRRAAPQYSLGIAANAICLFFLEFILLQIWRILIYPTYFSPIRHIPKPADGNRITGQTKRLVKDPPGRPHREWIETIPNDGLIRYSMWGQERLLLTTPKALGEVLVTKNYDFVKPKQLRNGLGRILGVGILLAEGDEHKIQRKNLMPAFAFRHIKDLYPVFWSKAKEMTDGISESISKPTEQTNGFAHDEEKTASSAPNDLSGTVEVGNWSSRATLDIIGLSGMGQDFNSLQDESNELNQTYRKIFSPTAVGAALQIIGVFLPFWLLSRLPIQRNHDINGASVYIKQLCRDLIAKKRVKMAEKERTEVDIISVALESGGFTDEELVNQMMTFLVAGHETTATAMIWGMYLLCKHPEVQQKLREEVRAKLPSLDQDITPAELDDCQYLQATCKEILRLWAPVSLTLREADCDTSINGQFVPKGMTIILAPWAINTSKQLWGEDAQEFKPERWLDADGKANNKGGADSNFSFLTFLHGPRSCIGQKFAQAEFECLVAAWVGRFETSFIEGSPISKGEMDIKGGVTAKPKVRI